MTNNIQYINISDISKTSIELSEQDLLLYGIKNNSKDHLKLLYHYTFQQIFNTKKCNINTVFIMDDLNKISLNELIKKKYINFLISLQKLLPNIIIQNNTHLDPIFTNILMNLSRKSTKKKVTFYKLKRFSMKYGLTIINQYLEDPTYRYLISI